MDPSTNHRDLAAWREAMQLVKVVYRDTAHFPKEESLGLTAQIRRCAVSIPSNIAEGAARNSPGELIQILGMTCGSLAELETQLEIAVDLGYLEPGSEAIALANHVGLLVRLLRKSLRASAS